MYRIVLRESPNQSLRIHGQEAVRLVVCHTPEGAYGPMITYMTTPQSRRVSYHQLVREDGREVAQLVPFSRKAWHAGAVNSLSDGIAAAGFAHSFNILGPQAKTFARLVAERLVARGLKPRWTTDPAKGGFCRHADLQTNRSDPMSMDKWLRFVAMVQLEHQKILGLDNKKRLTALRTWILKRKSEGWSWQRIKTNPNWREFIRRGGK